MAADSDDQNVTHLLAEWQRGDQAALARLIPIVYGELRHVASARLRNEAPDHTLQTTALVHEAYVRLVGLDRMALQNRTHFFAMAARLMREILVDHARAQRTAKRGAGALTVTLDAAARVPDRADVDVLLLDDALNDLARLDERQSRIVELRYFTGLSIDETSEVMGISPATVSREWTTARAWLHRQISGRSS